LTSILALATGLALLAASAAIRDAGIAAPAAGGETRVALVRDFYDAANTLLATGDPAPLDRIVSPDLVEHPARLGTERGRAALVRALLSRRAAFPALRLVLEEARPGDGDLAIARVRVDGAAAGAFLGLPVPGAFAAWGPLDLFRVAGGRIVEHWGEPEPLLVLPLEQATVDPFPAAQAGSLLVSRIDLPPSAAVDVGRVGVTEVLVGEAGSAELFSADGSPRALAAGGAVVLPPNARLVLRGAGTEPAVVLAVAPWSSDAARNSVGVPQQTAGTPDQRRASSGTPGVGVEERILASADVLAMPGPSRLATGRVVMAPGTVLSVPADHRLLVAAVEEGRLEVVGGDTGQTVMAGWATVAATDREWLWRAGGDGPTTLLLLAVAPLSGTQLIVWGDAPPSGAPHI
jgi:predicted ester cyclase